MEHTASIRWKGDELAFEGSAAGGRVELASDSRSAAGPSPMALVLIALGACSGMDVVSILLKMRQPLEELWVEAAGDTREEYPQVFTAIRLVYHLRGELDERRVRRAIELSETKYCPVGAMLKVGTPILSDFVIERGRP